MPVLYCYFHLKGKMYTMSHEFKDLPLFNMAEQRLKATQLYARVYTGNSNDTATDLIQNLEKSMTQHLKVWWNSTKLEQYITKQMVPRGLSLKKLSTSTMCEQFTTKWNKIWDKLLP